MKIPVIKGIIDRRILINYTVDPGLVTPLLPQTFRPKTYKGKAIVGICLIRLKNVRPKGLPAFFGVSSENGAHRIAVEWDEHEKVMQGVYIPRRDTSLRLNEVIGGRLFPGKHHLAKFDVVENHKEYRIRFLSSDGTKVSVTAIESDNFDSASLFENLDNVSKFFEMGSTGYSPRKDKFDGIQLRTYKWEVRPLKISNVQSSFFDDEKLFPSGSIKFDNALIMTNIGHEWKSVPEK